MFTQVTERLFGRMHRGEDGRAPVMQPFPQHVVQCLRPMGAKSLYAQDLTVRSLPGEREDVIKDEKFALHGFIKQFPLLGAIIKVASLARGQKSSYSSHMRLLERSPMTILMTARAAAVDLPLFLGPESQIESSGLPLSHS